MSAEPTSRESDSTPEPAAETLPPEASPETTGERARLDHFLEYRARALQRRRTQWRVAATALVCGGAVLVITVVTIGGGRLLRARMTPRPIASPSIVLSEPSASPPTATAPTATEKLPAPEMHMDTTREPTGEPSGPAVRAEPEPAERPARTDRAVPADRAVAADPKSLGPKAATARLYDDRRERLSTLHPGDTKERVFELFGTTFERQAGSVVRVDGMRLRARGRSPRYEQVEVADVKLANDLYWFAFGEGRLIAWGRPADWRAVAQRQRLEVDYPP
jgi:hypothetical protein